MSSQDGGGQGQTGETTSPGQSSPLCPSRAMPLPTDVRPGDKYTRFRVITGERLAAVHLRRSIPTGTASRRPAIRSQISDNVGNIVSLAMPVSPEKEKRPLQAKRDLGLFLPPKPYCRDTTPGGICRTYRGESIFWARLVRQRRIRILSQQQQQSPVSVSDSSSL